MPRKSKTDAGEGVSPVDQIQAYLEQNKGDHYNFEEERSYAVSSGSLLMDIEMGGGIGPGVIRASGITEGGKTSCALAFAKNFQKMDNSMVVYFKAEGRLTKEMVKRAGIDQDPLKWREIKSNVYETVINLMRQLVQNNDRNFKYMFIIDSMDSLVPKNDLEKGPEEANKVAGGALLSSDFLRKMALGLSTRGHICPPICYRVLFSPHTHSPHDGLDIHRHLYQHLATCLVFHRLSLCLLGFFVGLFGTASTQGDDTA